MLGVSDLDDLVCTPQATFDAEGDDVTNIYSWTKNSLPYANLILPFDTMTDPDLEYSGFAYTNDYSGYDNFGNVFSASWTDQGIVGGAYSFDGNDFIRIEEQGNSLGGDGSWDEITVEFWIQATENTNSEIVLYKHGRAYPDDIEPIHGYTGYRVDFSATDASNQIYWRVYTQNITDPKNPIQYYLSANIPYGPRDWHHVACTYTSGEGMKIYADGVEASSASGLSGSILETNNSPRSRILGDFLGDWGYPYGGYVDTNKGPLEIAQGKGSDNFRGMLDEVRIYPSEIGANQIYQRYMDTKGRGE